MAELDLLRALLLVALAVAPLSAPLFAEPPRGWRLAHGLALAAVAVGLFSPLGWLTFLWPVFCLANAAAFVLRASPFRSPTGLASGVPFVFSFVAATWLVGGANDLRILGYGAHFSFYAALHGTVLGWTLVGTVAALATQKRPRRPLYLVAVFVSFASFLLVALGIDSLAALKPVGVAGLSVALPAAQLAFLSEVRRTNRAAFVAGAISFVGLVFTLVLAWENHLSTPSLPAVAGVRPMVAVHGAVNGVIVGPALLLAVFLDSRERFGLRARR